MILLCFMTPMCALKYIHVWNSFIDLVQNERKCHSSSVPRFISSALCFRGKKQTVVIAKLVAV